MYKACSRCGKIHDEGQRCSIGRIYKSIGNERKLRSSYKWTKKSQEIRQRANYLCEVCRDRGVITYEGVEVHHITKIVDDESRLLDNSNLICLCEEHHSQADNGTLDADYLRRLAVAREKK